VTDSGGEIEARGLGSAATVDAALVRQDPAPLGPRRNGRDPDQEAALDWLPEASVAVQTTGVVPSGKTLPEGGTQTSRTFGSRSSTWIP
jgi:hypothetical protein